MKSARAAMASKHWNHALASAALLENRREASNMTPGMSAFAFSPLPSAPRAYVVFEWLFGRLLYE